MAMLPEVRPSSGLRRRDRSGRSSVRPCRSPASRATSRRRRSGRPASTPGRRRTRTGPGAFALLEHRAGADHVRARPPHDRPLAARRGAAPASPTRSRARCSSPAPRSSGCATGCGIIGASGDVEALAAAADRGLGRRRRAGLRRARGAPLGPARPRPDRRPDARDAAADIARATVDAMAYQVLRRPRGDGRGRRRAGRDAARGRRRGPQRRLAPVPGRPPRRPGRAPARHRDDRPGRGVPGRAGGRRLVGTRRGRGDVGARAPLRAAHGRRRARAARRALARRGRADEGLGLRRADGAVRRQVASRGRPRRR